MNSPALGVHIRRERLVVVLNRNEFHADRVTDRQQRVPHARRPVVFRPAEHSDVDHVTPAAKIAMPLDAGVRDAQHVHTSLVQEIGEERVRAGRFPQELVDLARGPVA
jgi:hypothetical protein